MALPGAQSGLIVEVPAAEPAVRRHRDRLDASAPLGVPAHITVLFPFMSPEAIDDAVVAAIGRVFAGVRAFRFELSHTDWFGGEVLWLGPRDPQPFRALTDAACRAFPAFPPYEGRFDTVVPHLTIGEGHHRDDMIAAESAVRPYLPIEASAATVTLMTQQQAGGRWARRASFPFRC